MNRLALLSLFFVLMISVGCRDSGEKKFSTGLVKNPNSANEKAGKDALPAIEFEKYEHDFGKMIQGEVISYTFKFTNTGKADLLISNVSTSCGCAATKFSKEPVPPGKEGTIEITFDSEGRKGFQNKTATILANTQPNKITLRVKAQVLTPENI